MILPGQLWFMPLVDDRPWCGHHLGFAALTKTGGLVGIPPSQHPLLPWVVGICVGWFA